MTTPRLKRDWRWRRAEELVLHELPLSRRHDDRWVARARRYLAARSRAAGDRKEVWKDVDAAAQIERRGGRRRLELQARILSGLSFAEISDRMGLDETVVRAYEALFFDVLERLDAEAWIALAVLEMPWRGPAPADQIMLTCAYHGGPALVDVWVDYLDRRNEAHDLGTEQGRLRARVAILEASYSLMDPASPDLKIVRKGQKTMLVKGKQRRSRQTVKPVAPGNRLSQSELSNHPAHHEGAAKKRVAKERRSPQDGGGLLRGTNRVIGTEVDSAQFE